MTIEDPRKVALKRGLRQLSPEELSRVINYTGEMVLDEFNYKDGCFCPLAVGVGLDQMADPSHEKVFTVLQIMGYVVNNTRGVQGDFYTTNRKDDLLLAASEVLAEKLSAAEAGDQ